MKLPDDIRAQLAAAYADQEDRIRAAAMEWFIDHPDAQPVFRCALAPGNIIATMADAILAGVIRPNEEARDLLRYMRAAVAGVNVTVGQVARAVDAARRVPP